MLPIITIEDKTIDIKNVREFKIDWPIVMNNIRMKAGYRMHEIATHSGCTHTRIQHLSSSESCRLSNCEMIALLDIHQDKCSTLHDKRILKS